ncbi:MAG: hypothetical protein HDR09_07305 [Lachnospiraceae bacterium]|nr:hypothetical protein [Lachnospiraceae bacterium]
MNKEMVTVTNGEMFSAIMARLDSMEAGLNKRIDGLEVRLGRLEERMDRLEERMDRLEERMDSLEGRVDSLEARIDKMESDNAMEFKAIRIEMDVAYKMLSRDIASVNDKVDRFLHTKDIEGYESMKIQVDLLTRGYQELKAKIS